MVIGLAEHTFAFKGEVAIYDENPRVSGAHGTKLGAKTIMAGRWSWVFWRPPTPSRSWREVQS